MSAPVGPGKGGRYRGAECSIEGCTALAYARFLCRPHYRRWLRHGDPRADVLSPAVRFERFVDRTGDCHRWTGSQNEKGYGEFWYGGRLRKAHVVALLLAGVDVPSGLTVDHVWARGCRFKDCVRIDHLEVVSNRVNVLRGNAPSAVNARKSHCKRDHEFTPENTRLDRKGGRHCRSCEASWNQARTGAHPLPPTDITARTA